MPPAWKRLRQVQERRDSPANPAGQDGRQDYPDGATPEEWI
ncbi:hypothetical protein [Geobacter sp. AOG1]|nr:hypothetical protein [Geobacter sp. AOG1]